MIDIHPATYIRTRRNLPLLTEVRNKVRHVPVVYFCSSDIDPEFCFGFRSQPVNIGNAVDNFPFAHRVQSNQHPYFVPLIRQHTGEVCTVPATQTVSNNINRCGGVRNFTQNIFCQIFISYKFIVGHCPYRAPTEIVQSISIRQHVVTNITDVPVRTTQVVTFLIPSPTDKKDKYFLYRNGNLLHRSVFWVCQWMIANLSFRQRFLRCRVFTWHPQLLHKQFNGFSQMRTDSMGKPGRIRDAMLFAAVPTLNGVGVIGNRLSSRLIDHLQPVREMHRHRQQPTERGASPALPNNDGAGASNHHVAMPARTIERCSVEAIDKYRAGDRAGDRAAAGGFIGHSGSAEAVEEHVRGTRHDRVGAMARQRARGRVGDARSGFSTQVKAPCY
ncbi:hypothetical protein PGR6_15110 [Pseudomonas sp. GR 6-02]|nr:hypothetical protein PGR6_15110 [Pseudomonas sp. GR 6-02]